MYLVLIGLPAHAVGGTRHALLVGVTEYHPSVSAIAPRLDGPGNDVLAMWQLVRESGFPPDQVTLLTSASERIPKEAEAIEPTRAEILAALDRIAATLSEEDEVLLYFAGHGAQLPDIRNVSSDDEPDGLDEVFLPADFRIDQSQGAARYANEIRDDEFGARIDRMIESGAHVWLIADTCHAGTLRRGDPPALVPRQLTLWYDEPRRSDGDAVIMPRDRSAGEFVAFYGAQAGDLAYETRVPQSILEEPQTHGILTWALIQAVQKGARDYRDLANATSSIVWQFSGGRSRPDFEGALGRIPMVGAHGSDIRKYSLAGGMDGLSIQAGRLDGLTEGESVSIGWNGSNHVADKLADARVVVAGLDTSRLELPTPGDPSVSALERQITAEGLDPVHDRDRWLKDRAPTLVGWWPGAGEIEAKGIRFGLGLAPQNAARHEIVAQIGELSEASNGAAEIVVDLSGDVLELRYGRLRGPLTFPNTAAGRERLIARLARLNRADHLRNVGRGLAHSSVSAALSARLTARPSNTADCVSSIRTRNQIGPLEVHHCDLVEVEVMNRGDRTLDLTPLYLAPDGEVYFLSGYADARRGGLRLRPGAAQVVQFREDLSSGDGAPAVTGEVTLLLLAVNAAEDGRTPVDFRYLQTVGSTSMLRSVQHQDRPRVDTDAGAVLMTFVTQQPEGTGEQND